MRGKIVLRTALHTITLANMYVGDKRIHYHLQYPNGGTDPERSPQDEATGGCDCIGFALNVKGLDRYQPGKFPDTDSISGGYINTDSMIEEAKSRGCKLNGKPVKGGQWFTVLDEPEDGCFIVGHSYRKKFPPFKKVVGHIGVVTDASEWKTKGLAGLKVVHCSPSNVKRPGNVNRSAVWKTDGTIWKNYPELCFIRFNYDYASKVKAA